MRNRRLMVGFAILALVLAACGERVEQPGRQRCRHRRPSTSRSRSSPTARPPTRSGRSSRTASTRPAADMGVDRQLPRARRRSTWSQMAPAHRRRRGARARTGSWSRSPTPTALGTRSRPPTMPGSRSITINSGSDVFQELGALTHVGQNEFDGRPGCRRAHGRGRRHEGALRQPGGRQRRPRRCAARASPRAWAATVEVVAGRPRPTRRRAEQRSSAALPGRPDVDGILALGPDRRRAGAGRRRGRRVDDPCWRRSTSVAGGARRHRGRARCCSPSTSSSTCRATCRSCFLTLTRSTPELRRRRPADPHRPGLRRPGERRAGKELAGAGHPLSRSTGPARQGRLRRLPTLGPEERGRCHGNRDRAAARRPTSGRDAGAVTRACSSRPEFGALAGAIVVWVLFAVVAGDSGCRSAGTAPPTYLDVAAQLGIIAVGGRAADDRRRVRPLGRLDDRHRRHGHRRSAPPSSAWPLWLAIVLAFAFALRRRLHQRLMVVTTGCRLHRHARRRSSSCAALDLGSPRTITGRTQRRAASTPAPGSTVRDRCFGSRSFTHRSAPTSSIAIVWWIGLALVGDLDPAAHARSATGSSPSAATPTPRATSACRSTG